MTSFSPEGEAAYGRRMVDSALEYWPSPLVVYTDAPSDVPTLTRATADIPRWLPTKGNLPTTSDDPDRYKAGGYLWNAQQFAVKVFVWLDAAERLGDGIVTWLDGDTLIRKRVPPALPAKLIGTATVAYLGRGAMHPETGYVGFRVPEALPLLRFCRDAYVSGSFRKIQTGWTDCHVLRAGIKRLGVPARDLTSHKALHWRSRVDAMALSPLGPYVHHLKGKERKRKALAS